MNDEKAQFAEICGALPEGVDWGQPLTPAIARELFEAGRLAKSKHKPLGEEAACGVFVDWYLAGGGGNEFVRLVEVAHGIREA